VVVVIPPPDVPPPDVVPPPVIPVLVDVPPDVPPPDVVPPPLFVLVDVPPDVPPVPEGGPGSAEFGITYTDAPEHPQYTLPES